MYFSKKVFKNHHKTSMPRAATLTPHSAIGM